MRLHRVTAELVLQQTTYLRIVYNTYLRCTKRFGRNLAFFAYTRILQAAAM